MTTWTAKRCADLAEIGGVLHDATYELDSAQYDLDARRLTLEFGQQWQWSPLQEDPAWADAPPTVLIRQGWWSRTYQVPLMRGVLTIEHVDAADIQEDLQWAAALVGLKCEDAGRTVRIQGVSGDIIMQVSEIDVTATLDPKVVAGHLERKVTRAWHSEGPATSV